MASLEPVDPVDIDPIDRDGMEEEDDKWDDNLMNELERRFLKRTKTIQYSIRNFF